MTVQISAGQIQVGAGDFVSTNRGVTWAIKCRDIGGPVVLVLVRNADGSWDSDSHPEHLLEMGEVADETKYPTPMDWFAQALIPRLNAWLHVKFGKTEAPPVVAPQTRLEWADVLINTRLQITVGADGYLNASLKEARVEDRF
jgi:hypothetical protein